MATIMLRTQALERKKFRPFGDVIETKGASHFSINADMIERFHDLATISIDVENGGRPIISIAKVNVVTTLPAQVLWVERHPCGSQAFIPMFDTPMIVVVAPAGDTPIDPAELRAFISNGQQGVNYHPGTWHMPLFATQLSQQFIIVDRSGPGDNCDEYYFDHDTIMVDS